MAQAGLVLPGKFIPPIQSSLFFCQQSFLWLLRTIKHLPSYSSYKPHNPITPMATLENSPKNYTTLVNEITSGQVKIPQFQRQFVWDKMTSARLIDSMIKGYPIGTFIFWRTDEELR